MGKAISGDSTSTDGFSFDEVYDLSHADCGARCRSAHADTSDDSPADNRRVALIKSLSTNNRFYALVPPDCGICNADAVDNIPHDLVLGIPYPCLEDGLNDFAVVRTTYETLELFPDEEPLRRELLEIIEDARGTLIRRLMELLERLIARKAHFLGTDLEEFKASALEIMHRGFPRHSLDRMMKVNVFTSVAQTEAARGKTSTHAGESVYCYGFHNSDDLERVSQLSGREFLLSLLADVLDSVMDEENYESKYLFDRNVFQQFIALIFITYSSTDPVFYGIHKDDYCVSKDKDMDGTPLYTAIGRELRRLTGTPVADEAPNSQSQMWADIAAGVFEAREAEQGSAAPPSAAAHYAEEDRPEPNVPLPRAMEHEELLMGHISSICATAQQMLKHKTSDSSDLAQLILTDAAHLVDVLKQVHVVSPLAYNPGHFNLQQTDPRQADSRQKNDADAA